MSFKELFLPNILICYVENGFYACLVCAAAGFATLTMEMSFILYFFGLGKYTKSHFGVIF